MVDIPVPQFNPVALSVGQNQPAPYNPLVGYGQMLQIKQNQLAVQQQQNQLDAREAVGQAYAGATNPDGTIDTGKLMTTVANDPRASYLAGDVAQQAMERQKDQYGLNQDALTQTNNRMNVVNATLSPLLRLGNNVTPSDVYTAVGGLHAAGVPTDPFVADMQQTMPTPDPSAGSDPAAAASYGGQLHNWLLNHASRAWSPDASQRAFTPNLTPINTGGQTNLVDTNPYTNPGAGSTPMQNTLSPLEQVAPQSGVTPAGAGYTMTTAARARSAGLGNLVPPGSGGGSGVPGADVFGTGRIPTPPGYTGPTGAPAQPGAAGAPPQQAAGAGAPPPASAPPTPPAPPAPPGAPSGAMLTGIGPTATAADTVAGTSAGDDLHTMYANNAGSAQRIFQLQQAQRALGNSDTGLGTQGWQRIGSFLNSVNPALAQRFGFDPTRIASYDETNKYLTQYASGMAGAMGSDSKLATALSGNASTHISQLAAQDVVKATIGVERMGQAQAAAWSQSGQPPSAYDAWAANWNRTADPRAYIADEMTPQQRATVLQGMSPAQRSTYLDQVWNAAQTGMIDGTKLGLPAAPAAGGQ